MTDQQRLLVQDSFAGISSMTEAAAIFYHRLFQLDPGLRPLFTGDMAEQQRKLMSMLAMIVAGLDRLDRLTPAVEELGRRHVEYRVEPEHYRTVGAALLWTLERGLGPAFNDDVRGAWAAAYALLTETMLRGAARPLEEAA